MSRSRAGSPRKGRGAAGAGPPADSLDPVWKALADPTRRRILDLLKPGPLATGDLVEAFPELSRFGVMKHLGILEDAGLVVSRKEGRTRLNYLNPAPIRRIYERWVSGFADLWSSQLLGLKENLERRGS